MGCGRVSARSGNAMRVAFMSSFGFFVRLVRSSFVWSGALAMFALVAGATLAFAQALPGQAVPIPPAAVGSGAGSGTTPAPAVAPANPVVAQTDPAAIAETNIRIERLEGELRSLTGQMEQLMFQMRQLQDELLRAREDTEFRLRELEGGQPVDRSATTVDEDRLREALNAGLQGAPPSDLGTLQVDANGQPVGATLNASDGVPLDLSRLTLNAEPDVRPQQSLSGTVASLDPLANLAPEDVYELGYDHVLRGDYVQAVATFGDFLDVYDDHRLRPNAHFWLGEAHFAMGSYTPAAEQFLAVFNNYPEDVKVPDALLKLAMSLERLGAQAQACATFTKLLTDYPRAPQIVLDTARTEQGLAGC